MRSPTGNPIHDTERHRAVRPIPRLIVAAGLVVLAGALAACSDTPPGGGGEPLQCVTNLDCTALGPGWTCNSEIGFCDFTAPDAGGDDTGDACVGDACPGDAGSDADAVDDTNRPTGCFDDSECHSTEYCFGASGTTAGSCEPGCRTEEDNCPDDLVCEPILRQCVLPARQCEQDSDCRGDQFCDGSSGVCRLGCRVEPDSCPSRCACDPDVRRCGCGACSTDNDCPDANSYCDRGLEQCVEGCRIDEETGDDSCSAGFACEPDATTGLQECVPEGTTCNADEGCEDGFYCRPLPDSDDGICAVGCRVEDTASCATGNFCNPLTRACEAGCSEDTDCNEGGEFRYCDTEERECTFGCANDADCGDREFCDGDGDEATHLCFPEPCFTNTDCGELEYCQRREGSEAGTCIVGCRIGPGGSPCDEGAHCERNPITGFTGCEPNAYCTEDDDCAEGFYCDVFSEPIDDPPDDALGPYLCTTARECRPSDEDGCPSAEPCIAGVCGCVVDANCDGELVCNEVTGACEGPCETNDDCIEGTFCDAGDCVDVCDADAVGDVGDSCSEARVVDLGCHEGELFCNELGGEEDCFRFNADPGSVGTIELAFNGAIGDLEMTLFSADRGCGAGSEVLGPLAATGDPSAGEPKTFNITEGLLTGSGVYYVCVQEDGGGAVLPYDLCMNLSTPYDCEEDLRDRFGEGDTAQDAIALREVDTCDVGAGSGEMATMTACVEDEDWFFVEAREGMSLSASAVLGEGTDDDPRLRLVIFYDDPDGDLLRLGEGPAEVAIPFLPETGRYVIQATGWTSRAATEYTLSWELGVGDAVCEEDDPLGAGTEAGDDDTSATSLAALGADDGVEVTANDLTLCSEDEDWFQVRLGPGQFLRASLTQDRVCVAPLRFQILAADLSVLEDSDLLEDDTPETRALTLRRTTEPGTIPYYVRVFYDGEEGVDDLGVSYDLSVLHGDADAGCIPDYLEPNDDFDSAEALTGSDGTTILRELSRCEGDTDWFCAPLQRGDRIQACVNYEGAGSMDRTEQLFLSTHAPDADGGRGGDFEAGLSELNTSDDGYCTRDDRDFIDTNGEWCFGVNTIISSWEFPSYDFELTVDRAICDDPFESVSANECAAACGVDSEVLSDVPSDGVIGPGDNDWWCFCPNADGSGTIRLSSVYTRGDIDMEVYDTCGERPVKFENGTTDREFIEFAPGELDPDRCYKLRTFGVGGLVCNRYIIEQIE